ncbi:MAG: hypothetical protein KUG77_03595, partial [Nannocystaceae bacterium]|nr:hypothetical protein [Nannocystaceae bacterium]
VVLGGPGSTASVSPTPVVVPASASATVARRSPQPPPCSSAPYEREAVTSEGLQTGSAGPRLKTTSASRRALAAEPVENLAAQVELLGVAEAHLARGASRQALTAATSHLASWPHGPLAQDAVRVAVRAHCAVDEFESAVALVRTHLPRVEAEAWAERRCKKNEEALMKPSSAGD